MQSPHFSRFNHFFVIPVVLFLGLLAVGCTYYRVVKHNDQLHIQNTVKQGMIGKIFILHQEARTMRLKYPEIQDLYLTGELVEIHEPFLDSRGKIFEEGSRRLSTKGFVKNELHVFLTKQSMAFQDGVGGARIPLSDILEVRYYEKDIKKSRSTSVLAFIGGVVAVLVVGIAVAAATKSSCPFIYSFDGSNYHLEGEAFGGAIFKPLERGDYLPLLHLQPVKGKAEVAISNELKEIQFVNDVKLIEVRAENPDVKILLDKSGDPHSVSSPVAPIEALDERGNDMMDKLASQDVLRYGFDGSEEHRNALNITFEVPAQANHIKLGFHARSSWWSDYLWSEYARFMGSGYEQFIAERNEGDAAKMKEWQRQAQIPLSISMEVNGEWQVIEHFDHTGPFVDRSFIVPVDLHGAHSGKVTFRFSTGYQFWEIDDVFADFSENEALQVSILSPVEASDDHGNDLSAAIELDDDQYVIQEEMGNALQLTFDVSDGVAQHPAYFLYIKGYYNHKWERNQLPNYFELWKFRDPLYYSEFSRKRFTSLETELEKQNQDAIQ
jgi:hypothetical protein